MHSKSALLQLRLLVGFLGERAQYGWWPTAFYESSSRIFLEPVFTKTSRLAQYHGVLEAARRVHDENLNVGSYHLFRLPEEIEQDLHSILQSPSGDELANQFPRNTDGAMESLKNLAGGKAHFVEGPMAVGNIKDLDSMETLREIAGAYLSAFSQDEKTYPYLVD